MFANVVSFLAIFVIISYSNQVEANYLNQTVIQELILKNTNSTRSIHIRETLAQAAGVYKDKEKGKKMGLERTVFTTVIAFNTAGIFHYKVYFQNFLCFARHYDFDVVAYVLHHHFEDVDAELSAISRMGVRALSYPDELFWRILAAKQSPIIPGLNRADYRESTFPSFQNHGALVMLVPLMEVLEHGFNAIFFDVDIGLVQDPVPFLTKGDADFVAALEPRTCTDIYPSALQMDYKWETAEPNTGVMHVRSTTSGRRFYRTFLAEIVDENANNDQRVFRPYLMNGTYTPNCNWNLTAVPTVVPPYHSSYCFLSEILFQNGLIAFTCPLQKYSHDDWVLAMHEQGTEIDGHFLPVAIHANYCDLKSQELGKRGLWLHKYPTYHGLRNSTTTRDYSFKCRAFGVKSVSHFVHNTDAQAIIQKRQSLLNRALQNGTLVIATGENDIFIVDESGRRHLVPDLLTFSAMNLSWFDLVTVPRKVMKMIPVGIPFQSVNTV